MLIQVNFKNYLQYSKDMMIMSKILVAILFSISILTACGSNDKKDGAKEILNKKESVVTTHPVSTPQSLEGVWEIKRAEGVMHAMNVGTVYEFKGDKLILTKDNFITPGKTEITDSTFSFVADVSKKKTYKYRYHFKGDTLVASIDISGGQVFYLARKQ
ncbi:MAG: hypothetical protein HOP10_05870 [Chitinophagaceae bacterium]|nr:hypothetical protein [Chitinophagaceae bacterium]